MATSGKNVVTNYLMEETLLVSKETGLQPGNAICIGLSMMTNGRGEIKTVDLRPGLRFEDLNAGAQMDRR